MADNNDTEQMVREFLRSIAMVRARMPQRVHGVTYFGPEDLICDRGIAKGHDGSFDLDPEETEVLFDAVDLFGRQFPIKQCFSNSQMIALHDDTDQIQYWEGWAIGNAVLPLHHAWVTVNGKVFDPTWRLKEFRSMGRLRNRVQGEIPEGWLYLGVEIPKEEMIEWMMNDLDVAPILMDPNFSLYKLPRIGEPPEPFPMDDASIAGDK